MNAERTPENISQPPPLDPPVRNEYILIFVKILITVMFMFPLAHYSIYGDGNKKEIKINNKTEINNIIEEENNTNKVIVKLEKKLYIPPSCPISHLQIILQDLCEDYVYKMKFCTKEDIDNLEKHKIPAISSRKNNVGDPRANIVGFFIVIFLIVLLTAAILELYKAKKQTTVKTNKAPLTRKCSLADLTVLKHHRKEMIRRDSMLNTEESKQPVDNKKAPPLQRSTSNPVEPISEIGGYTFFNRSLDSRRNSVMDSQFSYGTESNARIVFDNRRHSIIDARKPSIIDEKFIDRYSTGRNSIDINNSPERKHHARFVHRR